MIWDFNLKRSKIDFKVGASSRGISFTKIFARVFRDKWCHLNDAKCAVYEKLKQKGFFSKKV